VTVSASASILSADAKPEDPHANRRRKKTRATREHLVRKADGGTDHDSNIVMACAACNHERGDAPVDAYKKAMPRVASYICS
jgi:5-methylcytosine-specific restriction endonuclease McrA